MSIESVMLSNHLIFCRPLSFCPQSFPASGSLPVSQVFPSGGQSIGASASVLPMNIQGWFPLGWTGLISLQISMLLISNLTPLWSETYFIWLKSFYIDWDLFYGQNMVYLGMCTWKEYILLLLGAISGPFSIECLSPHYGSVFQASLKAGNFWLVARQCEFYILELFYIPLNTLRLCAGCNKFTWKQLNPSMACF